MAGRYEYKGQVFTIPQVNAELEKIAEGFDEALMRTRQLPNQMETELDMNGNRVINVGTPVYPGDLARLEDITAIIETGFPPQDGNAGGVLTTNGTSVYWNPTEGVYTDYTETDVELVYTKEAGNMNLYKVGTADATYTIDESSFSGGERIKIVKSNIVGSLTINTTSNQLAPDNTKDVSSLIPSGFAGTVDMFYTSGVWNLRVY